LSVDGCQCRKGTTWAPFKVVRENIPLPGAMTLSVRRADELRSLREAADKAISGRQSDAPGSAKVY
jgi:hypothetical protein